MFRIFREFIYSFLALAATIITIKLYINNIFPKLSGDAKFAVFFIGVLCIWFFLESMFLKVIWGRKIKYAETIDYIAGVFNEVHKMNRTKPENKDILIGCGKLCSNLAQALSLITGCKCNVAIKILAKEEDDDGKNKLQTVTFCRSHDLYRNSDDNSEKHWLDKNTDFLEIFKKMKSTKEKHFLSNLLPFRYGYLNTSFDVYGEQPDNNILFRYWRWPLPYKSTIVVPICPSDESTQSALRGFLCVDSPNIGAFKKNYDISLLRGVADGLFNVINKLNNNNNEGE